MREKEATADRVTLGGLAAMAGVSMSTVSKVLNARPDVSEDTRARVEIVLRDNGYKRRGTDRRKPNTLELVFHELDSAWSMQLIKGIELVARENRMSVILTESGSRHSPGPEWIAGVLNRRPAGVILVFSDLDTSHREKLRSRDIPFVIIDPAGDPSPGVPAVGSANWSGGLAATRHLIELGHTRIATITGPEDMMCSLARLDGYKTAMNSAGLDADPRWVRFGDFTFAGGRDAAIELLSLPSPPSAIFGGSDLQALGVLDAARSMGLDVPRDLSVVGYDDLPLAQWFGPHLTTIHQPLQRMAEEAARLVLRLRDDPGLGATQMDLATHLVVRDSTGPFIPAQESSGSARRES